MHNFEADPRAKAREFLKQTERLTPRNIDTYSPTMDINLEGGLIFSTSRTATSLDNIGDVLKEPLGDEGDYHDLVEAEFGKPFSIYPDLTQKGEKKDGHISLPTVEFVIGRQVTGRIHIDKITDLSEYDPDSFKTPIPCPEANPKGRIVIDEHNAPITMEIEIDGTNDEEGPELYNVFLVLDGNKHLGETTNAIENKDDNSAIFAFWKDDENAEALEYLWPQDEKIFPRISFIIQKVEDHDPYPAKRPLVGLTA